MTTIHAISDKGGTHDMDPKYGSFLSYQCFSSGNYVTLWNVDKEKISGYVTTIVRLGVRVIEKENIYHVP